MKIFEELKIKYKEDKEVADNEDVEEFLTKGKRYKVYSHDMNPSIRVISDDGKRYSFSGERFQNRQDVREEKLKQLGI